MNLRRMMLSILILTFSSASFASAPWNCYASDAQNKQWVTHENYRKVALNKAFEQCKQQSKVPESCQVAKEWCAFKHQGIAYRDTWQCIALDDSGHHWPGPHETDRSSAVESAQQLCKSYSGLPQSCYVRLLTCEHQQS